MHTDEIKKFLRLPNHHQLCKLASILNGDFLTRDWPWERIGAKRITRNIRCNEDSVLLTREGKSELLRICRRKAISPIASSASAVVVVAWSVDARGCNVTEVEGLSQLAKGVRKEGSVRLLGLGCMSGMNQWKGIWLGSWLHIELRSIQWRFLQSLEESEF